MANQIRSVLFVTYHFPPEIGGIQTRMERYLAEFEKRHIEATVIFLTSDAAGPKRTTVRGAEVLTRDGHLRNLVGITRLMMASAIGKRVDAIHCFTGASTIPGLFSMVIARMMRVNGTISFFGVEGVRFSSLRERVVFEMAGSLATSIATNTLAMKRLVPRRLQGKTFLLYGGADEVSQSLRGADADTHPVVLFVGRLVQSKGVDDLVKAFASVSKVLPESRLVLVGDGPFRAALQNLVAELGLTQRVEFKGALRGEALLHEYARCSVFVLPSKHTKDDPASEALGLVLVEASMHGKPLVGTRVGGIPEVIRDGENGFLVAENDVQELARTILRLLTDDELAEKIGRNSLRIAVSEYTWARATDRLLSCYSGME